MLMPCEQLEQRLQKIWRTLQCQEAKTGMSQIDLDDACITKLEQLVINQKKEPAKPLRRYYQG